MIRHFINDDSYKIKELLRVEVGEFSEEEIDKKLKNSIFNVVYEKNDEVIGFATINKGCINPKKVNMLLYVSEKYRGTGIGKALYATILEYCNKEELEYISIEIRTEKKDTGKFFIDRRFKKWFSFTEMEYLGEKRECDVTFMNYDNKYYEKYKTAYEDCFFEMRQALDFNPVRDCYKAEELIEKKDNIFLLMDNDEIVGSVSLIDGEIDDLFVNQKYQGKGYAKKLIDFAINYYQENKVEKVYLGVADWNERAVKLYESSGFVSRKKTCVYRINLEITEKSLSEK